MNKTKHQSKTASASQNSRRCTNCNYDISDYAPWIVRACDRVAAKPDNQVLTNTETDALIRYLHGDEEMEAQ